MPDLIVSSDIDTLLQSATNNAARTSLKLGSTDIVEFGGVVIPAGTTAELDAVTTATVGELMVDTDKPAIVRFTSASNYEFLRSGGGMLLSGNDPTAIDVGSGDFSTQPQTWANGGISLTFDTLLPREPVVIRGKGWSRVHLNVLMASPTTPADSKDTGFKISVSGSAEIRAYRNQISVNAPTSGLAAFNGSAIVGASEYEFDFNTAEYDLLIGASAFAISMSVDVFNPTDADIDVGFFYHSPVQYAAPCTVTLIQVEQI